MKVRLQDVVDGILYANAETQFYYHTESESVVMLLDSIYGVGKDKKLNADIDAHPDQYLPLPNEYEVDETAMMADFVDQIDDSTIASALFRVLDEDGNRAARQFKQMIRSFEMASEWTEFRDACYEEIARMWCDENEIEVVK